MIYLYAIIVLVYAIVVISLMVAVLMGNRQPAKTMAWLLVILFVPIGGIVLYALFGRDMRKERLISQRSMDELTKRSMFEFIEQGRLHLPNSHLPLLKLFANENVNLPFKDNEAKIYTNGYDLFLSLLSDIGHARHHIHLDTYIIANDPLGNLVADVLIDKAREGVEVRFIYDDVGCWNVPNSFFERMRRAGVDVQAFMPVRFPVLTSKVNYRNHRKICVVDGSVGYIGGMNIATRYVKGTSVQAWRDTHMRVRGGAGYGIQRAFLVDWYFVTREMITDRKYYPEIDKSINNNCIAQVVASNPISPWPDIMQGYVRILLEAKRYVYMESPYFLPTETVMFALRTAAQTGVDVRLIVPRRGDSRLVGWASRSYVLEAMEIGVKVYFYKAGFNHSKLLVSDDSLCTCGSTNIDFRSFDNNFEANIFFYDKAMAARVKRIFIEDQRNSVLIDETSKYVHHSVLLRLWESVVRLLSPLL